MGTLPRSKGEGVEARAVQGEESLSKMVKVERLGAFKKLVNSIKKGKKERKHEFCFLYTRQTLSQ